MGEASQSAASSSSSGKGPQGPGPPAERARLMSRSQKSELQGLFDDIDRQATGRIAQKELQDALKRLGLPHDSPAYIEELMLQFDKDGDGSVDFQDFMSYARQKEGAVAAAFAEMDKDCSSSISVSDLEQALKAKWLPLDHADAERMIHLLDRDHNGIVSYDEFRRFVFLLPESQVTEQAILQSWVDSADWVEGIEYHVAAVPPKQGFQRFVAGGIAGGLSKTAAAPLDRLRIMMMADSTNTSLRKTALKMWQDGGLLGLFRGNLATMLKVVPQTATQFAVYDGLQQRMLDKMEETQEVAAASDLTKAQHLFAGGVAGAAAALVTYPLETVRTHMCMGGKSSMAVISRELFASFGLCGYFRGSVAALGNAILTNALGFTVYETAVSQYKQHINPEASPSAKGACSGVAACGVMAVVMPLENIQRRLQIQGRDGYPVVYSGTWDCAKRMLRAEGVATFWRGSLSSFLKVAPSLAAVRFAYEVAMHSTMVSGIHKYRAHHVEPPEPPDPHS